MHYHMCYSSCILVLRITIIVLPYEVSKVIISHTAGSRISLIIAVEKLYLERSLELLRCKSVQ